MKKIDLIFFLREEKAKKNHTFKTGRLFHFQVKADTYLIAQFFSEKSHKIALEEVKEQLKIYALNAAEKVGNLSKELKRLSVYLEEELDSEREKLEEDIFAKTEKINSAIHMLKTFKNFNDTSLNDWRGVIPDELEERDEEQAEREEELEDIIRSVEEILPEKINSFEKNNNQIIRDEIKELKKEIIVATRNLNNVRIRKVNKSNKPQKEDVHVTCPNCNTPIQYRQKPIVNSHKPVLCKICGIKSTARWYEDKGFQLEKNYLKEEQILCPNCNSRYKEMVDTAIFVTKESKCKKCESILLMTRNINGLKVRKITSTDADDSYFAIDGELLKKIKTLIPPQPWPTNTHKSIASNLGISNNKVKKAIAFLIQSGDFYPQIDGVIYYPKKNEDA